VSLACPSCAAPNSELNLDCASCGTRLPEHLPGAEKDPRHTETPFGTSGALVGRMLGPYRIESCLARGSMGLVFRALDTRHGRNVALKLLGPPLAADPRARARFQREVRAASALDHPNVGSVFGLEEADEPVPGQLFITMALYEGETLEHRLRRGALPAGEAASILGQIAAGLAAAHTAGIVHRDLKPANVMLVPASVSQRAASEVRILDFGLAKLLGSAGGAPSLTASDEMLGTLAYIAPEQIRGAPVDPRVDLWSLGVVAYEMLAGVRPFEAHSGAALLYGILGDEPPPLKQRRPGLPEALLQIVDGLLVKEPGRRIQSAAEVLDSL
jgi:eukaryotic-like serine/threonine-protein kinase